MVEKIKLFTYSCRSNSYDTVGVQGYATDVLKVVEKEAVHL